MGCGASKAALVSENDINISAPPRTAEDDSETEENTAGESKGEVGDVGRVDPVYSSQSEIERAVREATSPNTTTPSFSSAVTTSQGTHAQNQPVNVPTSISAPMVFEVCMSPDDHLEARAPLPQRLKKLESAPVVTAEMLEMKQLKAAEKKKEELEKRFARSRMSRKDRLRKEIMAARELQSKGEEEATMTESFGYSRLQEEPSSIEGGKETREGNGYDNNTHVEGDTTYNAEESGEFWSGGDGEVGQTSTSGGREVDLVRQSSATPGGSSNSLEQYM